MAALDLLLAQALSPSSSAQATAALQTLKLANPAEFLLELGQILGKEDAHVSIRQLAGLLIKNICRNEGQEEALKGVLDRVPADGRENIRFQCLSALGSQYRDISEAAAQAVASLAAIEYPNGQWRDIVPLLISACSHVDLRHRKSAFLTIGYFLDQLPAGALAKQDSDDLLTAIYTHICGSGVELEAVKAFGCALQFTSPYFQREQERALMMKMLIAPCKQPEGAVRTAGLENLCEAAKWFYDYLSEYIGELWQTTSQIVTTGSQKEAILALEVWNIVSEIEASRKESEQPTCSISSSLALTLCPLLFTCLSQPLTADPDDWTIQKASGALLVTLAEVVGDPIVDLSLPFIITNLRSTESNRREAAVLTLGSVLEGPEDQKLQPLVSQGFPYVISLARDEDKHVRAAALWTLSRICEHQIEAISGEREVNSLWTVLLDCLKGDLALLACSCTVHLLQQPLCQANPAIGRLFQPLLDTAMSSANDLQLAAFSALQTLMQETPFQIQWNSQLLALFRDNIQLPNGSEMREMLLCASIQIGISRSTPESISESIAFTIVESVIAFFRKRRRVIEEGINVIGALVSGIGKRIVPAIGGYWDYVLAGLGTDSGTCKAAIICVGDHARGLDVALIPYLPTVVQPLFQVLESSSLSIDLKVQCIATLGDLVTSTQSAFLPYLPTLMPYISAAATASLQVISPDSDLDLFECLQELREAIVDFFASVVQGLTDAGQAEVLSADLAHMVSFAGKVVTEEYFPTDNMHMAVLGLMGDLALAYGERVRGLLTSSDILQYARRQEGSANPKLRSVAKWTLRELQALDTV